MNKPFKISIAVIATLLIIPLVGLSLRQTLHQLRKGVTGATGFMSLAMTSRAMSPTAPPKSKAIFNMRYYQSNPMRNGDMVVMALPDHPDESTVRRIIALEGEIVSIKNGIVHINGRRIKEPYVSSSNRVDRDSKEYPPLKVYKDHVFVLGDNRDWSKDSRDWGTIPKSLIQGKVLDIIPPLQANP